MARHSPCVGICRLDEVTGFCLGCGRTGSEVAAWLSMEEAEREDVWSALPARLANLAVRVRLLPWTREELGQWACGTIGDRSGTWVTGAPGALAEFPCTAEREIEVESSADGVVARAHDSSFRLRIGDKLRAFAFEDGGPIVLGLPKLRAALPSHSAIEWLGADGDAIDEANRSDLLFDFGVGRQNSRFCVRTGDKALVATLSAQSGRHWSEAMAAAGTEILSASPHRVVESATARIEVKSAIPMPGSAPPTGAHTHFLPEFLTWGDEIPASLALPEFAAPTAIFYPRR